MSPKYSQKLLDHFNNPRNVGVIACPDAVAMEHNESCGDSTTIHLKIRNNIIVDAKFQTRGCGPAIATSSIATELIKGKHLSEVRKLTRQDLADALGGLPAGKIHCSVLITDVLRSALIAYETKRIRGLSNSTNSDAC